MRASQSSARTRACMSAASAPCEPSVDQISVRYTATSSVWAILCAAGPCGIGTTPQSRSADSRIRRPRGAAKLEPMDAREVERAETRLHELELESWGDLALAGVAFGAAFAGTWLLPDAAAPLLVGGLGVTALGVRALIRRSLLLEDLAADPDTYTIEDVRKLASKAASVDHRRALAASIHSELDGSPCGPAERVETNRDLLEEIGVALEDELLPLDPAAAVALDRL